jgi:hypothetical protein
LDQFFSSVFWGISAERFNEFLTQNKRERNFAGLTREPVLAFDLFFGVDSDQGEIVHFGQVRLVSPQ